MNKMIKYNELWDLTYISIYLSFDKNIYMVIVFKFDIMKKCTWADFIIHTSTLNR